MILFYERVLKLILETDESGRGKGERGEMVSLLECDYKYLNAQGR